ncbi:MAG: flavin-containing monooxygenase [Sporichthyaceae bacterium]
MTRRVAIIGAGISGLAHADVLTRCGFSVVLFERAAKLGGVWACSYPQVRLQNTSWGYHLSSFPWPFTPDLHPTSAQICRYLEAFVAARGFDLRMRHEVLAVTEAASGGWDVRGCYPPPDGGVPAEFVENVDHVVVSVGQYTEGKHRPALGGEAEFAGEVVTERDLGELSRFDGARVVVVGFGKSALDMATLAAPRAAAVHHVFRTPRWTLPLKIFRIHYTRLFFNRFGSVMMTSWAHPTAAERFLHRRERVVRSFWGGLQSLVARIARREGHGHGPAGAARLAAVLPEHALLPDLRSAAALAPTGYYRHVGAGTIEPHRADITALSKDGVHLSTGEFLGADVVVLSVGSRTPAFPFLDDALRARLEDTDDGPQLYRHVVHPSFPQLGFAGFNHGFMHIPAAEIGALWLAALWRGELQLAPREQMEREVAHVQAWKRAHIHHEPSRGCAVNTRFQQYLDIMLADLGISPYRKLPNVFAEVFSAYRPADYADVVDEFLASPPATPRLPVALPT